MALSCMNVLDTSLHAFQTNVAPHLCQKVSVIVELNDSDRKALFVWTKGPGLHRVPLNCWDAQDPPVVMDVTGGFS